jgi:hypothetical protein
MTLAIHTRAKEGMQDFATAALEVTFFDPAVDTPLKKSLRSGGTRIRTGDTMIFSYAAFVYRCC